MFIFVVRKNLRYDIPVSGHTQSIMDIQGGELAQW